MVTIVAMEDSRDCGGRIPLQYSYSGGDHSQQVL